MFQGITYGRKWEANLCKACVLGGLLTEQRHTGSRMKAITSNNKDALYRLPILKGCNDKILFLHEIC